MRIAIVLNTSWNIYNFRMNFIDSLRAQGHEVHTVAPVDDFTHFLTEAGCVHHPVRMARLDKTVESLSLANIDFIKIDVEGFEPEVLLGGETVIEKFHPWLYVEITPAWLQGRGHSMEQFIGKLLAWNYELLGEVDKEFIPYLKNEQLFRSLHQFNLLAKPLTFGE